MKINDYEARQSSVATEQTSHTLIRATRGLEDKERKKLIKWAEDKDISARKIVPAYKQADEGG